jgi:sulfur carrier protein ThiS
MSVLVTLSTTLRDSVPGYDPAQGLSVPWAGPVTIGQLAESIGLPVRDIQIIMHNGRHAGFEQVVHDNDRVGYFPAVGGG